MNTAAKEQEPVRNSIDSLCDNYLAMTTEEEKKEIIEQPEGELSFDIEVEVMKDHNLAESSTNSLAILVQDPPARPLRLPDQKRPE